ncbi:hypothetical protein LOTGIDRAFT_166313, partial [Lottia gigantea]
PAVHRKGKTWGPSSVQKDRHQRSSIIFADGRWSKSAPNLEKSLKNLGAGHSNTIYKEETDWPIFNGDQQRNIPTTTTNSLDSSIKQRSNVKKKYLNAWCGIGMMLASVGSGFDIRVSNSVAIHPQLHETGDDGRKNRDAYIGNRRDAYLAAVRDNLIEGEGDYRNSQYANPSAFRHTYHGVTPRQRPSIQMEDSPPEGEENGTLDLTPFMLQKFQFNKDTFVISPTPSNDRPGGGNQPFRRQYSKDSNEDHSRDSIRSNKQRHSVTFEDNFVVDVNDLPAATSTPTYSHKKSPSDSSSPSPQPYSRPFATERTDNIAGPIPPRRKPQGTNGTKRPTTLALNSNSATPTSRSRVTFESTPPQQVTSSGQETPIWHTPTEYFHSTRSRLSPGNTPPHISHQKTLLDIDVEGQSRDSTRPLVSHNPLQTLQPQELDREFMF